MVEQAGGALVSESKEWGRVRAPPLAITGLGSKLEMPRFSNSLGFGAMDNLFKLQNTLQE
jgi:hypothetical protein